MKLNNEWSFLLLSWAYLGLSLTGTGCLSAVSPQRSCCPKQNNAMRIPPEMEPSPDRTDCCTHSLMRVPSDADVSARAPVAITPGGDFYQLAFPELGATMQDCGKMGLPLTEAAALRSRSPYKERLSFIRDGVPVLCWVFREDGGFPWYIIGVFDSASPPRLVELFSLSNGTHLVPMYEGGYVRKLREITPKTKIEDVFTKLGHIQAPSAYRRLSDGRWVVEFAYFSVGAEVITYVVDAGTGVVIALRYSHI